MPEETDTPPADTPSTGTMPAPVPPPPPVPAPLPDPEMPRRQASDKQMTAAAWIVGAYLVILTVLIFGLAWDNFEPGSDDILPEAPWEQITLLLASFGTLATGAAGVLLGTTIQQFNVHTARREAVKADREAEKAKSDNERIKQEVKKALDEAMAADANDSGDDGASVLSDDSPRAPSDGSMQRVRGALANALSI